MLSGARSSDTTTLTPTPGYRVGHGIVVPESGWTFGGDVWQAFDEHIRASVPGYDNLHRAIVELAAPFLSGGGQACDLGCSTGTLTSTLARRFPKSRVLGVDVEPAMVRSAKRLSNTRPVYTCASLETVALPELDFAVACYTFMFLPPSQRPRVLARIRRALKPGCAFVFAEKVKRRDPAQQALAEAEHRAFKLRQGLSEAEIVAKSWSLRRALVPHYADENVAMLERAGFVKVRRIFSKACFDAWLALS